MPLIQGHSSKVEQRSPKPSMWVRFLLPLLYKKSTGLPVLFLFYMYDSGVKKCLVNLKSADCPKGIAKLSLWRKMRFS